MEKLKATMSNESWINRILWYCLAGWIFDLLSCLWCQRESGYSVVQGWQPLPKLFPPTSWKQPNKQVLWKRSKFPWDSKVSWGSDRRYNHRVICGEIAIDWVTERSTQTSSRVGLMYSQALLMPYHQGWGRLLVIKRDWKGYLGKQEIAQLCKVMFPI